MKTTEKKITKIENGYLLIEGLKVTSYSGIADCIVNAFASQIKNLMDGVQTEMTIKIEIK